MSEMIREYGKTVTAILATLLVMALLFGELGFWTILSKGAQTDTPVYKSYKDTEASKTVSEGTLPRLEYRNLCLKKGDSVSVENLFFGLDGDGNFLEVKVLEVLSPQGNELPVTDGIVSFEKMGIYKCQVCTTDSQGRRTEKTFKIPVLNE